MRNLEFRKQLDYIFKMPKGGKAVNKELYIQKNSFSGLKTKQNKLRDHSQHGSGVFGSYNNLLPGPK